MLLSWRATFRFKAPRPGGERPRTIPIPWASAAALLAAGAACAATSACSKDAGNQVTQPVGVGMTDKAPPYYADGQITIYQAMTEVKLPVRKPTAADMSGAAPKGTPYSHAPFLVAADESIEVRYVIANLDKVQRTVWLLVDPWNEFVRWKPGITVVNDETTVPNYGYDQAFVVPAQSRIEGTLTADDMTEIATKLAAVENLLASPEAKAAAAPGGAMDNSLNTTSVCNNIFNPQNRSNSNDLLYMPWIPPVVAGVTGFDIGLRTLAPQGAVGGANVAVEVTVQVQDLNGDRVVAQDDSNATQIGVPSKELSPPAARF